MIGKWISIITRIFCCCTLLNCKSTIWISFANYLCRFFKPIEFNFAAVNYTYEWTSVRFAWWKLFKCFYLNIKNQASECNKIPNKASLNWGGIMIIKQLKILEKLASNLFPTKADVHELMHVFWFLIGAQHLFMFRNSW